MRRFGTVLGACGMLLMGLSLWETPKVVAGEDAESPAFYTARVQPVLQRSCYSCHGGMNHRGGFNMQTREGMLKGGHDGPALVPGDVGKSLMVHMIRHEGKTEEAKPMPPPPRPKLSDAEIATVEAWIRAGAAMPADAPKP